MRDQQLITILVDYQLPAMKADPWLRVDKSLTAFRINFPQLREPDSYLVIDHSVNP